jgi:sec-independent protein translocase protein TatA
MTLLFIGTTEIIVIALIILLLFGGAKLPSLMKGLGKGVKDFKDEVAGVSTDDKQKTSDPKDDK